MPRSHSQPSSQDKRAVNLRTGFLLLAIALVFFVGIIASNYFGGATVGLTVLGSAVVLYLAVAIGRNVSSRK